MHDADVEAGEMIKLQAILIGEQSLEVGRGIVAVSAEADEMLVALAVGQLDQAQSIAPGDETSKVSCRTGPMMRACMLRACRP